MPDDYIEVRLSREHVKDVLEVCEIAKTKLGPEEQEIDDTGEIEMERMQVERVKMHFKSMSDVFKHREEAERLETALKNAR